jgi:hypothetical protein
MTAIIELYERIVQFLVMTWKCTIDEFHDSMRDD